MFKLTANSRENRISKYIQREKIRPLQLELRHPDVRRSINEPGHVSGWPAHTLATFASSKGKIKVLRLLHKEFGIDPDAPDNTRTRWTPLHHAAHKNHLQCVRFLVESCQARRDICDTLDRKASDLAQHKGYYALASYLEQSERRASQSESHSRSNEKNASPSPSPRPEPMVRPRQISTLSIPGSPSARTRSHSHLRTQVHDAREALVLARREIRRLRQINRELRILRIEDEGSEAPSDEGLQIEDGDYADIPTRLSLPLANHSSNTSASSTTYEEMMANLMSNMERHRRQDTSSSNFSPRISDVTHLPENSFVRWYAQSFHLQDGVSMDGFLQSFQFHGFDNLLFWFKIVDADEDDLPDMLNPVSILRDVIRMPMPNSSLFLQRVQRSKETMSWFLEEYVQLKDYSSMFERHDMKMLSDFDSAEISNDFLSSMGVSSIGHRCRILLELTLKKDEPVYARDELHLCRDRSNASTSSGATLTAAVHSAP